MTPTATESQNSMLVSHSNIQVQGTACCVNIHATKHASTEHMIIRTQMSGVHT